MTDRNKPRVICIDFDDTISLRVKGGDGLDIIGPVPHAIETIKALSERGDKLILWTMRDKNYLFNALKFLHEHSVTMWAANENPEQDWSESNKAYCNLLIDDNAFGCPLVDDGLHRPYVDWLEVQRELGLEV